MQLNEYGLKHEKEQWEAAGYQIPQYDHEAMVSRTMETPYWLHFGSGNIFRAFQTNVVEGLLNRGELDRGIIAVGGSEAMEKLFHPHDNYTVLVTLKVDGTIDKTIIGSVAEALTTDAGYSEHFDRLKEIFTKDSLQMVSFTITEKGYSLVGNDGEYTDAVKADFENGPEAPVSYMGKIAAFLYARYKVGATPISMVSMDNCSHNGDVLHDAVAAYAEKWFANGLVEEGFVSYINVPEKVAFPWSMIDKITPRPDKSVEELLKKDNIDGLEPIKTKRNTFIAPFVNAEESQYLVIEDLFPNGRPALDKGGIIFTDRETVEKVERMKVCTCLNPLHTVLAIFGCLMGYEKICDEMKDPTLRKLVEGIGYKEGLPVVTDPGVINPKEFIDNVINVRLANPFKPDTPQRIVTDTSQKLAIRFGETIKAYRDSDELDVADLKLIPLVFAGWARYLTGVYDNGEPMDRSSDPILPLTGTREEGLKPEEAADIEGMLRPMLSDEEAFGVNLYEVGMADQVVKYFKEMITHKGAVRDTLDKYVNEIMG